MQEVAVVGKEIRDSLKLRKVQIVGFMSGIALTVASASAAIDLNATIGPILDSITELIPSIIGLIVAIVPAIIVMAVVGFIVAFFDKILGMLKF